MKRSFLFTTVIILFTSMQVQAQWLSGRVKGESGAAAAAVSVEFLNKDNKISTNKDGSFKIFAPNLPDTLIFSSPGYEPYKVIVTEKNIKDPNFEVVLLNKRERMIAHADYSSSPPTTLLEDKSRAFFSKDSKAPAAKYAEAARMKSSAAGHGYDPIVYAKTASGRSMSSVSSAILNSSRTFISKDTLRKPGSLTAGEVNDFKKWKMWEDLTEKEFSTLSTLWGIVPKQRFSVQLVDKNHRPVAGEKVF